MLGITVNEIQRSLVGLGDIPNDFEAAKSLCYTPVRQGWFYGIPYKCPQTGAAPIPPKDVMGLGHIGLGDTDLGQLPEVSTGRQNFFLFLQVLSTVSVATLAFVAFTQFRTGHGRRL
jgi:hypothetical protein